MLAPSAARPSRNRSTGTRADGAAAGQRDAALAFAGEQRADDPEAGAHLRDQLVGSGRIDDGAAGEVDGARIAVVLALAAAVDGNVDAVIAEDADQQLDIGQMRHVFERQRIAGQQRGDHQRQGGILGAGNRNDAVELITADNSDTIHVRLRAMPAFLKGCLLKGCGSLDEIRERFNSSRTEHYDSSIFAAGSPFVSSAWPDTPGARLLFAARDFPRSFSAARSRRSFAWRAISALRRCLRLFQCSSFMRAGLPEFACDSKAAIV